MRHHYRSLSDTKQQYRQIVGQQKAALEAHLREMRTGVSCESCASGESSTLSGWMMPLHAGCGYRAWQQAALSWIENDVAALLLQQINAIGAYRNTFDCHLCGMCCRMASADKTYEQLKAQAEAGDDFARQFTSIFLPYASREAAAAVAPSVVEAVLAEAADDEESQKNIYFYHCPYLGEDNRCTVYGTDKRPAICGNYPETPLVFVYENCGWQPWKAETHADTLAAHALLTLCTHWSQTLRASLEGPPVSPI